MKNELQGNAEWFEARRGVFTGSKFKTLMGKGRGKDALFSDTGMSYIRQKVAERFGSYEFQATNKACDWGNTNEPLAIQAYEFKKELLVEPVGFSLHDEHVFVGASADGLLPCGKGGIEVKSPYNPANHIRYATDEAYIIKEHGDQLTGNMFVYNLEFMDFISFDPRSYHDIYIKRFFRDEKKISDLEQKLIMAEEVAQEMIEQIEINLKTTKEA